MIDPNVGDHAVRCPDGHLTSAALFTPPTLEAALHRLAGANQHHTVCDSHEIVCWDGATWQPVEIQTPLTGRFSALPGIQNGRAG